MVLFTVVGALAGVATPSLAALFGVSAARWPWVVAGLVAGVALGWRASSWPPATVAAWLVVLAVGVPLAAVDLGVHRLPDPIVLPTLLVVAAALAAAYAAVAVLPRSALGFGDVKLAGGLGTALGLLGWGPVLGATVFAFALGGAVAVALLATGRARRDTALPFGPYLLAGAGLAALTC